jgi:hypothetical protein
MKQTAVEFVTYELALRMKQLGFDEPCFGYYYTLNGKDWKFAEKSEYYRLDDEINIGGKFSLLAPLYQQAFRWFREKHKLNGEVNYLPNVEKYGIITSDMAGMKPKDLSKKENFERGKKVTNNFVKYDTYEEAELACLEKLIEIVEQIKSE